MQGNGFYVLTGAVLIGAVVTAMVVPKKGDGDVAQQPHQYTLESPVAAAEDISGLRVPTVEPRIDPADELPISMDEAREEEALSQESQAQAPIIEIVESEEIAEVVETAEVEEVAEVAQIQVEPLEEELVSETFSSTTPESEEIFHGDEDLFTWPVDEQIIYEYSDNDVGKSFMNPTLDRTMRSFGLFLKTEEAGKVKVAGQGKVVAVTQYPTADIARHMDYPQVGLAVIVEHGNNWKSVYGLHTGSASVEEGDLVQAGDIIGSVGKPSQDFSLTGPNLYFQMLKNDVPINPKDMLK